MKFKRIFLIVMDSLGVGEAIDANNYGDTGANTLGHILENNNVFIPNLKKLGFLNTLNMNDEEKDAYYTIARPTNPGKDSLDGHYEIVGIKNEHPFKTYEDSFPRELLEQIAKTIKMPLIGNKNINGEKIIEILGDRHLETKALIVYTSNGSNLKIAAHEDVLPVNELYDICEKVRQLTTHSEWKVGRVVAKPFIGKNGNYRFIKDSKEFALDPPTKSIMDSLKENKYNVIALGKINDCFNSHGITKIIKTKSNIDGLNKLNDIMEKKFTGLCICNLSDFDSDYAHKKDIEGYARAIEEFDVEIPLIINKLNNDDLLIITADHGCDPTLTGNHTRENVPVIIFGRNFKNPKRLDILETMADIGATIADNFEVQVPLIGKSFLDKLN